MDEKYLVWNQEEKYYVVCFGLNFETFDIWSRDCPSQTIALVMIIFFYNIVFINILFFR